MDFCSFAFIKYHPTATLDSFLLGNSAYPRVHRMHRTLLAVVICFQPQNGHCARSFRGNSMGNLRPDYFRRFPFQKGYVLK
jgi:hypothetical protein